MEAVAVMFQYTLLQCGFVCARWHPNAADRLARVRLTCLLSLKLSESLLKRPHLAAGFDVCVNPVQFHNELRA